MKLFLATALLLCSATCAHATTETFDTGLHGWTGPEAGVGGIGLTLEATGGNPGPAARIRFNDFGVALTNASATEFIGDLRAQGRLTIAADIKVADISSAGDAQERDLVLELRSHELAQPGYPWASVYVVLAHLNSGDAWATHAVTFDAGAAQLPSGWGGYGAEDPHTAEPMLPANVSYAQLMASVDEIAFSTLVPGYAFAADDFDVSFDNIRISAAPAPVPPTPVPAAGIAALFGLGALLLGSAWRRRRRAARQSYS